MGLPQVLCLSVDVRLVIVFHRRMIVLVRMSGRHVFPLSAVPQVVHDVGVLVSVDDGIMGVLHGLPLVTLLCVREPARGAGQAWRQRGPGTWLAWPAPAAGTGVPRGLAQPWRRHGRRLITSVRATGLVSPGTMVSVRVAGLGSFGPTRYVPACGAMSRKLSAGGGLAWDFRVDEDLSASFVRDNRQQRLEFDRQLAGYVRRHRERWDITAVLEPLQLLAAKTGQVEVHLHRSPAGRLAVTLRFELEPGGAAAALMRRSEARSETRWFPRAQIALFSGLHPHGPAHRLGWNGWLVRCCAVRTFELARPLKPERRAHVNPVPLMAWPPGTMVWFGMVSTIGCSCPRTRNSSPRRVRHMSGQRALWRRVASQGNGGAPLVPPSGTEGGYSTPGWGGLT